MPVSAKLGPEIADSCSLHPEMLKSLSRRRSDLSLVVVGEGPYYAEMQQELQGAQAIFTGYLTGDDLAAVYASCDLFLFPSTTDTFGNVVLEAQASGIPVIVSDVGGPRENVIPGETGLVVAATEESLTRAVLESVADPLRLREMGRAARRYREPGFCRRLCRHLGDVWDYLDRKREPGADLARKITPVIKRRPWRLYLSCLRPQGRDPKCRHLRGGQPGWRRGLSGLGLPHFSCFS